MANIKSAKKRDKQRVIRTKRNKSVMNNMRTHIRHVEVAISENDKDTLLTTFKKAQSVISRAAKKGVIHKNTASRKIANIFKRVKLLIQ